MVAGLQATVRVCLRRSPSPRPSPLGRGRIIARFPAKSGAGLAGGSIELPRQAVSAAAFWSTPVLRRFAWAHPTRPNAPVASVAPDQSGAATPHSRTLPRSPDPRSRRRAVLPHPYPDTTSANGRLGEVSGRFYGYPIS